MDLPEELSMLKQLHADGDLTDYEFAQAKARVIEQAGGVSVRPSQSYLRPAGSSGSEVKEYTADSQDRREGQFTSQRPPAPEARLLETPERMDLLDLPATVIVYLTIFVLVLFALFLVGFFAF